MHVKCVIQIRCDVKCCAAVIQRGEGGECDAPLRMRVGGRLLHGSVRM